MAAATEFGIVDAHVPHFVGAVLQEFQVIRRDTSQSLFFQISISERIVEQVEDVPLLDILTESGEVGSIAL